MTFLLGKGEKHILTNLTAFVRPYVYSRYYVHFSKSYYNHTRQSAISMRK